MLSLSFFAKPCTKKDRIPALNTINIRKPPDFPLPGRAIRSLDYAAAEVGGNQSAFGIPYSPAKRSIANANLICKARERLGFECSHASSPEFLCRQRFRKSL
jgi:hypothetical protein